MKHTLAPLRCRLGQDFSKVSQIQVLKLLCLGERDEAAEARGQWVLNIGKLRRGGENYYLNSVARGVEDYYLGSGEAPGYWLAGGADDLGLAGEVGDEALRRVLRATHPGSTRSLVKGHRERVPGFDLTFLAPKSVALLHELGSKEASNEAMSAHDAAVAAALDYLERHASGARRGKGGRRSIGSNGFIAAAFRHRTSRAGDPLLHTHVLVANLIKGEDGKWGAVDAKHLYRQAKTAGYLYQAHLRAELARRLGVQWSAVRKGAADIEGIPREAIEAFSKRRREVQAVLSERAATGRQREVAALRTRQAKDYSVSPQKLLPEWRDRAAALGLTADTLEAVSHRTTEVDLKPQTVSEITSKLVDAQGLTAQASSFSRREVLQGFCSELAAGASVREVEALADQFLASSKVVSLSERADGAAARESERVLEGRIASSTREHSYSTAEMLDVERDVIERALERRFDGVGVAPQTAVSTALERRTSLFPDQQAMVTRLASSGAGVEVVVGKAGAGKTFALDAAREAWESSGHRVIGCSLSARAAQELQAGSGIQSFTIASLLQDMDRPEAAGLRRDTVVVVDEAGMVGTRTLERILGHAERASAKVVLVGDDRQLPEIEAGGAFRGIKNRLPPIELAEVRRQPFGWERDVLDLLREGHAEEAIRAYTERGRVFVGASADDTRRNLVADWWQTQDDAEPGVMIAARRSDVADLNARARELLVAHDRLGSEELEVAGERFAVGDRVMTLKNTRNLGVFNGTRAVVAAIDTEALSVTLRLGEGQLVTLPSGYLESGHLTHAYAITGHKAQGMTTRKAFVLGDETLYREWGYVAMSRGKETNSLYVVTGSDPEREQSGGQIAAVADPMAELTRALGRSRAKDLAIDVYEETEVRNLSLSELRVQWDAIASSLETAPADVSAELEHVVAEHGRLQARIAREERIQQEARQTRAAMTWWQRRRRRPECLRLEAVAQESRGIQAKLHQSAEALAGKRAELEHAADQREKWLADNAPAIRHHFALERELWWREQHRSRASEVAMAAELERPATDRVSSPERAAWTKAASAVEEHRAHQQEQRHSTSVSDTRVGQERDLEPEGIERSLEL